MLAPCGLRVTQFSLLTVVAGGDGVQIGALAEALDMDRTTLTRNLGPLLDAGLVVLERSEVDARRREVRITADGRVRQAEARKLWRRAQNQLNRTLGDAQVAALHATFDGLLDTLNGVGTTTEEAR